MLMRCNDDALSATTPLHCHYARLSMRGLESPNEAGPRPRRFSPHTTAILALASILALCLLLPNSDHLLQGWTETLSTTVSSSLESAYGYVGWRKQPVAQLDQTSGDENATFVPAMRFDATLPACDRTFTFIFESGTGFNGQMGLLVRTAVLAEALGYHLLMDDDGWIYGRWTDYFAPYTPTCMPSDDWQDRSKRVSVEHKTETRWKQAAHVWGPLGAGYLDELTLTLHVNRTFLDDQHRRDIASYPPHAPLSSQDTVPDFFVDSFKAQSKWMAKLWKLSPLLTQMVEEERETLGWDLPGWDDRPRRSPSDVVIGAHVRMGDKCFETNALKAGPLRFAKALLGADSGKAMDGGKPCTSDGKLELDDRHAQAYFDAATAEVNAVLSEHAGSGIPASPMLDTAAWEDSKPTLIIMSDEDAVLEALRQHEGSRPFRLLHTANAKVSALEHGFDGASFLNLTIADRVRTTRPMVRDMELLSRHAGGLVFMSTSNVGRILALLPGFKEVQEGRLMAVDSRWFPTAYWN